MPFLGVASQCEARRLLGDFGQLAQHHFAVDDFGDLRVGAQVAGFIAGGRVSK